MEKKSVFMCFIVHHLSLRKLLVKKISQIRKEITETKFKTIKIL